ncbi:MAG TPA: hypothetical protein VMT58_02055, partial [Candidatus Binataceae bacterium]|nr:hypothetical protein [Candidatus Binataceae bacterium]
DQFWPAFKEALAPLGDYEMTGGIALYKVAPQIISAYRDLPGAALEARAVSLRFDSILEASAKFLATGHDASNLSPLELLNAKLLPATWRVDAAPDAYSDWTAVRLSNDKLAVAVTGTYDALRPLIDRYLRTTAKVYCPAPRLWTPKEMPIREKWVPLVIEFDRAGLAAAAAQLKSSPPSERTTPFLAWVKAWRPPN